GDLRAMLIRFTFACSVLTTCVLAATPLRAALPLPSRTAIADDLLVARRIDMAQPENSGHPGTQERPGTPPSPKDAMDAYQVLDSWIGAWNVPEAPVKTALAGAASITLRLSGEVVGRSTEVAAGAGEARGDDLVWKCAKAAVAEAARRLPGEKDALR